MDVPFYIQATYGFPRAVQRSGENEMSLSLSSVAAVAAAEVERMIVLSPTSGVRLMSGYFISFHFGRRSQCFVFRFDSVARKI